MKDFAKKIKMEDARINLRKQQLEKIIQQKARAQAQTPQKDVKMSDATSESTTTTGSTLPMIAQPVPTTAGPNTLHPSLPLKPPLAPVQTPSLSPAPAPAAVTQLQTQPLARSTPPPAPVPAPAQPSTLPPDPIVTKHEESKHRWSWIALRTARDNYLQHFGKIGPGDIVQLEVEIEKEKKEREKEAEAEAAAVAAAVKVDSAAQNGNGSEGPPSSSELTGNNAQKSETTTVTIHGDGDVKMEGP